MVAACSKNVRRRTGTPFPLSGGAFRVLSGRGVTADCGKACWRVRARTSREVRPELRR